MTFEEAASFAEENMKTIFAWSLSRVSHKEDAEDLAGDIIAAILESAPRVRDPDAFFGYVWAIAKNTYKLFIRKKNHVETSDIDDLSEDVASESCVENDVIKAEESSRLHRELALLSHEYHVCTVAYYFDGLSCADISKKYAISLEMVKYYLYKTRKKLKEGIPMERTFGEKSFNPTEFTFCYTYDGQYNAQYDTLFKRKLSGNILLAAYYTPMSVTELSVELGVACAYLEDEIRVLEKYNMLTRLPSGKYQTKLVFYTREFFAELMEKTKEHIGETKDLFDSIRAKLPMVRSVGFRGCNIPSDKLLWALGWALLYFNFWEYGNTRYPNYNGVKLYENAYGVCYGYDFPFDRSLPFCSNHMAGRSSVRSDLQFSYICSGIIPEKNRYSEVGKEKTAALVDSEGEPPFPVFTEDELRKIREILADENNKANELYIRIITEATKLMKTHAPECIRDDVPRVLALSLGGEITSILFYDAVNSGALALPAEDDFSPNAFYAVLI